jgi:hypothetical protein
MEGRGFEMQGGCAAGRVFLQSDVEEAAASMHDEFRAHASQEFRYELREQPITEAELLGDISCASAATARPVPGHLGAHAEESSSFGVSSERGQQSEQHASADSSDATKQLMLEDTSGNSAAQSREGIPWSPSNLIGVPTEREMHSALEGEQVYRVLLVRQR